MIITIDRIEKNILVVELEDGQIIDVPCALIPNAQEGAVYEIKRNGVETEKQRIEKKMDRLFCD